MLHGKTPEQTYQHKHLSTYSSRILEETVAEFSRLPGIGKRTALRLVLHLLKSAPEDSERLGNALVRLRKEIRYCSICHNITERETCAICSNPNRDESVICVVEDIRDVIAIENTNQFHGKYHVLGGIISPMDGIGPSDLAIDSLISRLKEHPVKELIMALSATMEGDTTSFFIFKKIASLQIQEIRFSTIARGVSIGDELEYADEVTLGRSILNRVPYENSATR
ncbi:MAG: recombination protein RecR [Bacteroidetes bacterium]|nr:recombination protein RecR [Bacteroidota bacterium]